MILGRVDWLLIIGQNNRFIVQKPGLERRWGQGYCRPPNICVRFTVNLFCLRGPILKYCRTRSSKPRVRPSSLTILRLTPCFLFIIVLRRLFQSQNWSRAAIPVTRSWLPRRQTFHWLMFLLLLVVPVRAGTLGPLTVMWFSRRIMKFTLMQLLSRTEKFRRTR